MSADELIRLWFGFGLLGSVLWWLNYVEHFKKPRCPTPNAIFWWIVCSTLGPFVLLHAGGMWLMTWLMSQRRFPKWWTTPICLRKKSP